LLFKQLQFRELEVRIEKDYSIGDTQIVDACDTSPIDLLTGLKNDKKILCL